MVLRLWRALPGVRALLVAVALRTVAALDPGIGGSGPHAFTDRAPHHSSGDAARVHRSPPDVRDDAYAPPIEAGCVETTIFFCKTEEEYFSPEGLTSADRPFRLSEVICPTGGVVTASCVIRAPLGARPRIPAEPRASQCEPDHAASSPR